MQITENKKIFSVLFFLFLIFYSVQISINTSKPDIMTLAIRALSEIPILDYVYLASNTLLEGTALPNYHLGHTLVLWFTYYLAQSSLENIIWHSDFVLGIREALIVERKKVSLRVLVSKLKISALNLKSYYPAKGITNGKIKNRMKMIPYLLYE